MMLNGMLLYFLLEAIFRVIQSLFVNHPIVMGGIGVVFLGIWIWRVLTKNPVSSASVTPTVRPSGEEQNAKALLGIVVVGALALLVCKSQSKEKTPRSGDALSPLDLTALRCPPVEAFFVYFVAVRIFDKNFR
jgi:hypothetical protein